MEREPVWISIFNRPHGGGLFIFVKRLSKNNFVWRRARNGTAILWILLIGRCKFYKRIFWNDKTQAHIISEYRRACCGWVFKLWRYFRAHINFVKKSRHLHPLRCLHGDLYFLYNPHYFGIHIHPWNEKFAWKVHYISMRRLGRRLHWFHNSSSHRIRQPHCTVQNFGYNSYAWKKHVNFTHSVLLQPLQHIFSCWILFAGSIACVLIYFGLQGKQFCFYLWASTLIHGISSRYANSSANKRFKCYAAYSTIYPSVLFIIVLILDFSLNGEWKLWPGIGDLKCWFHGN